MLAAFDLILARDEAAKLRFEALGGRVEGLWDAKLGVPPLVVDDIELARLSAAFAGHHTVLAASTHPGEDEIVLAAFKNVARRAPDARLTIIPRHPARGPEVETLARSKGFQTGLRSQSAVPEASRVYVADTLGELGLFFRLARAAFVGGSLTPGVGGHNPLEPARLGCPFAAGRHTDDWPIYETFRRENAARTVADAGDLAALFRNGLDGGLGDMAARARTLADRLDSDNADIAPRLLSLLGR